MLGRWIKYCSELYNYESYGDSTVLDCSQHPQDLQQILHEAAEIAVAAQKYGKSARDDKIPAELFQAGGEALIVA